MRLLTILSLIALPAISVAHHSTSQFDEEAFVEIDGIVVDVFWRNPHVVIKVAADMDNPDEIWELEGASVSQLSRRGFTRDTFKEGDFIRAAGHPSSRNDTLMLLTNVLLPSGSEVMVRGRGGPRWQPDTRRRQPSAFEPDLVAQAKADAEGIFRVWTWGRAEPGWWFFAGPERFPLTDAGLASLDGYDEYTDNPVTQCIAPGMPATMANPYPMTFGKVGDDIQYRSEEFDILRTIHMNADAGASVEPSPLGYSVGHWEDNTLVVRTTNINAPYFNRVGVRQSADVVVDERFTVSDDGSRLDWEIKVTDPETLQEPWAWGAHWNWSPGEEVGTYDCTVHD
jgi:hypothetical protein